ncbi:MAG: SMI1/KNR4 family protein [Chitinophagaceae bacterium]|nr:SMI1/KNR4 family protein [Chitinophagaceae bacterium]MCW5927949.1 SMI1/KNR4 family protein [Chitinophagaceae bacterium]
MNVDEICKIIEEKGFELRGCSLKEVSKIESLFQTNLPATYIDFLTRMGKGAGNFLRGSSAFYNEIFYLKEWASELLLENDFKSLPEDAFVFFMHQGYQFAFFCNYDNDDPPVYYYHEGMNLSDFEKKEERFTDFLTVHLGFLT